MKNWIERYAGFAALGAMVSALSVAALLPAKGTTASASPAPEQAAAHTAADSTSQKPTLVRSNLLEEDPNSFALLSRTNVQPVDCAFVGCGGLF